MNIKERFYANLEMIREDYDKDAADWAKKRADNARFAKSQAKADHLLARIDPNYRKEKEKEAKHYNKLSKKYAKKAVTGMDEEAEQLDESSFDPLKQIYGMISKTYRGVGRTIPMKKNRDPGKFNISMYGKEAEDHYEKQSDEVKRKIQNYLREPSDSDISTQYKHAAQKAKSAKKAVTGMDEEAEQLDEARPEKLGRYISDASKEKSEIQDKMYYGGNRLKKGELRKFEKRKKGIEMAIKKLTGQAKVPSK